MRSIPENPQIGDVESSDVVFYDIFGRGKVGCTVGLPQTVTRTIKRCEDPEQVAEANKAHLERLGPFPLSLLDNIQFQRDYTVQELETIRSHGLESPPPHIIRMRSQE